MIFHLACREASILVVRRGFFYRLFFRRWPSISSRAADRRSTARLHIALFTTLSTFLPSLPLPRPLTTLLVSRELLRMHECMSTCTLARMDSLPFLSSPLLHVLRRWRNSSCRNSTGEVREGMRRMEQTVVRLSVAYSVHFGIKWLLLELGVISPWGPWSPWFYHVDSVYVGNEDQTQMERKREKRKKEK